MKVGIFVPVYRESDMLEPLLKALLADPYPDKEIIACVDEPTEKTEALIAAMSGAVRWRVSAERQGKVNALNKAVEENPCDAIIFLDSDIAIHQDGFVGRVVEKLDDYDLIEIKKKIIRDSFVARIVNYDYLSENFSNLLFAKYLGRCLSFNGSAFAIKRSAWGSLGGFDREICEDLDMATRAYISKLRFGYAEGAEVQNRVDPSWGVWAKQRRRWGTGQAQWIKRRYRMILRSVSDHPQMLLGALLILFPSIPMFAATFAFPDTLYVNIASFILVLLAGNHFLFIPPVVAMLISVTTLKAFSAVVVLFTAFAAIYRYFAHRLGYAFNILEFAVFFFAYNPLWLTISLATLMRELIWKNDMKLDWKI